MKGNKLKSDKFLEMRFNCLKSNDNGSFKNSILIANKIE